MELYWRLHRAGAPSLDHLRYSRLPLRQELASALGIDFTRPAAVVAYHPVTLLQDTTPEAESLFQALATYPGQLLFCFPNADAGSRELTRQTRNFLATRRDGHLFVNLAPVHYWAVLREAQIFVGNSSSGIMETASFALPTVNIGERQKGRERARNVLDAPADTATIARAMQLAMSSSFRDGLEGMTNPYGDGTAAARILHILTTLPSRDVLLWERAQT